MTIKYRDYNKYSTALQIARHKLFALMEELARKDKISDKQYKRFEKIYYRLIQIEEALEFRFNRRNFTEVYKKNGKESEVIANNRLTWGPD